MTGYETLIKTCDELKKIIEDGNEIGMRNREEQLYAHNDYGKSFDSFQSSPVKEQTQVIDNTYY